MEHYSGEQSGQCCTKGGSEGPKSPGGCNLCNAISHSWNSCIINNWTQHVIHLNGIIGDFEFEARSQAGLWELPEFLETGVYDHLVVFAVLNAASPSKTIAKHGIYTQYFLADTRSYLPCFKWTSLDTALHSLINAFIQ